MAVQPTLREWPGPSPQQSPLPADVHQGDGSSVAKWKGLPLICTSCDLSEAGRRTVLRETNYVPGGKILDLGRKNESYALTFLFIGEGYLDRYLDFKRICTAEYTDGELQLPRTGEVLTAHLESFQVNDTGERDSIEVSCTFLESSITESSTVAWNMEDSAANRLPAGEAKDSVLAYEAVLASDTVTAEDARSVFLNAIALLAGYMALLDLDTTGGIEAEENAILSIGIMVRRFPFPDILEEIL